MQDHITLETVLSEGIIFDVNALMRYLAEVSDRRSRRGRRYSLSFLLSIIADDGVRDYKGGLVNPAPTNNENT